MTTAAPRVVLVICNWNGEDYLRQNLESIRGLTWAPSATVLADNASRDRSLEIAREYPEVEVLASLVNLGGAGGFNLGIRHALAHLRPSFVMLLDHDVRLDAGALEPLLAAFEDPDVGAAAAAVYRMDRPDRLQTLGCRIDFKLGYVRPIPIPNGRYAGDLDCAVIDVDESPACALMIRAEALRAAGLMDEEIFLYFDDMDLHRRIRYAGYRSVVVGASKVWHKHAWGYCWVSPQYLYYRVRNDLVFYARHTPPDLAPRVLRRKLRDYAGQVGRAQLRGFADAAEIRRIAVEDFLSDRLGRRDLPVTNKVCIAPIGVDPGTPGDPRPIETAKDDRQSLFTALSGYSRGIARRAARELTGLVGYREYRRWRRRLAQAIVREQARRERKPT